MADQRGNDAPDPERQTFLFPKLRPPRPAQHRRQPTREEMAFEGTQTRNRKLNLRAKYGKQYEGKHRKKKGDGK